MAKSKNHTNHNQGYKNHRNGIKRVPRNKYIGSKAVNQTLLRNTRRAKKFDPSITKQKNLTSRIATMKQNKAKLIAAIDTRKAKKIAKRAEVKKQADAKKGGKK